MASPKDTSNTSQHSSNITKYNCLWLKMQEVILFFKSKYALGMLCLALVVFLWVSAGFLIENILNDFHKPFFLTYFANVTFQLYFVVLYIQYIYKSWKKSKNEITSEVQKPEHHHHHQNNSPPHEASKAKRLDKEGEELTLSSKDHSKTMSEDRSTSSASGSSETKLPPMTKKEMIKLCAVFFLIYFLASYFANASFGYTDVLSASILLSTSCVFTLVFGIIFKLEKFTFMKALSVIISAGGVIILAVKPEDPLAAPVKNRMLGNIFAVCSSALYGVYSIMLKKVVVDEDRINMPFFFGFVGLFTMICLWPFFIIFNVTEFETWEVPSGYSILLLSINYLFGTFLSNYCWLIAVLNTSPLMVAIGLSLSTPLTFFMNCIIKQESILDFRALAGIFVIIGFVIINFASLYPKFNYFFENLFKGYFSPTKNNSDTNSLNLKFKTSDENLPHLVHENTSSASVSGPKRSSISSNRSLKTE